MHADLGNNIATGSRSWEAGKLEEGTHADVAGAAAAVAVAVAPTAVVILPLQMGIAPLSAVTAAESVPPVPVLTLSVLDPGDPTTRELALVVLAAKIGDSTEQGCRRRATRHPDRWLLRFH
jgi:hypothetical protein